jgi:IMP dehydrogenase
MYHRRAKMDNEKTTVKDYMTKNVYTVRYDTLNKDVIQLMKETKHDGYPVVDEEGHIVGIITAYDLLLKDWETEYVSGIMSTDVIVAREDMHINDASRVMFRHGISRLPVVDKKRHVKGIMTNTDIVRSHIERSTPTKVSAFRETMEKLYDIKTTLTREAVPVEKIKPTQDRVYADELQGRTYELEKGLAEPTIVVKTGDRYILVDGHHRAVASKQRGYETVDSYVVDLGQDIKLGMEKTADKAGIKTFDDIEIIDDDKHPLIALTESLQDQESKGDD